MQQEVVTTLGRGYGPAFFFFSQGTHTMTTEPKINVKHQMFVEIDYTNWRGERRKRLINPVSLTWGASKYHEGNQWLLLAMDCEDKKSKEFAMKNIHSWTPQSP